MNIKISLFVALAAASIASASSFYWSGNDGIEQVATGFNDGTTGADGNPTNGFWYEYDDSGESPAGTSMFTWPSDVETNEYGSFFGPMVQLHGGITGTANLTAGYTYPYLGIAFNIGGTDKTKGFDVSSWEGICINYTATSAMQLELVVANEFSVTKMNNYSVTLPANTEFFPMVNFWDDFKQETGWGTEVPISTVLSNLYAIKIKFTQAVSGFSNTFFISSIGSCNGYDLGLSIDTAASKASAKATLVGRSLSFSGVTAAANVEVISLQGQVLMAGKVGSNPMNLSKLNAGVYMVRVNGENVNLSQRVVVP